MAEKTNVPEIRFAGFTDPWEQRKLGELGFAQSGIGFPDAEQGGTKGTPFFKVSDMNTPGNEYELVASNNYVTAEQIARMGWRPINQVPAIFFAKVGAAVMLNRKRLVNEPFLLDNNTMAFSMDSSLLDTQFGRSLFERLDLTSLIQVGALPSFNSSDVESISVSLPSTMNEQRQIGEYLCDLNTLITLHQRKCQCRSLCGYLSWEQCKLGELLLFQNGFNGSGESFGSGIPLISVMDVLDDGFITHEAVRGKARLSDEEASRYCVEYGDVLFQRSSENQEDAGTSNVYLDQHVSSAFGGFVIRGKKVGDYNPFFIKYLLSSSSIREQITHRAQGAQHINVSQDTLNDVALLMSSMREQEAIGLVLLHLDNLITLHQREPQFTDMGYMRVERALMTMSISLFSSS